MAGISLPGLGSGLDTASIVSQLMQIEAQPQKALKTKVSQGQLAVTALQTINTKTSALQTAAQKLYKSPALGAGTTDAWVASKATASSSSVAVTAGTNAQPPASLHFSVKSLADAFFVATDAVGANDPIVDGQPPTLNFSMADGTTATVNVTNNSIAGVVAAINAAQIPVKAAAITQADGTSRLQLTSATTGAANSFSVSGLSVPTPITHAGNDAVLDFGSGLTASSATNTFKDLMPGVSLTVSKVEADVNVDVAKDASATSDAVKGMVDAANAVLAQIKVATAATPGASGKASTTSPLTGNATVRALSTALQSALNSTGVSPGEAGVSIDRSGTFTFDATKFAELMAKDPAKAKDLVSGLASRLDGVAKNAADPTNGTLASAITSQQNQIKDWNKQVDAWDDRLSMKEAALKKQFSALDVAMQQMQSQSSWLSGQIAGLASYSSSSNKN